MLTADRIIERANELLKGQGTEIRSRQIKALAEAITEEINIELNILGHVNEEVTQQLSTLRRMTREHSDVRM